jgi:agmatinase
MYNALKTASVSKLVSVGLRDVCEAEMEVVFNSNDRITPFFDHQIKAKLFEGGNWSTICDEIIAELPQKVYVSFDIDGLDPKLCPNTGTPVPGGLSFEQAVYLLRKLVESERTIIGFDLCEVNPSESTLDANVGARILYHLGNLTGASNGRMPS